MTNPQPTPNVAEIAGKLTKAQREALLWLTLQPQVWPKGAETSLYCLARWMKGDPKKRPVTLAMMAEQAGRAEPSPGSLWGRTLWKITPLGLQVKAHLEQSR